MDWHQFRKLDPDSHPIEIWIRIKVKNSGAVEAQNIAMEGSEPKTMEEWRLKMEPWLQGM
jgi:hypothetical protein